MNRGNKEDVVVGSLIKDDGNGNEKGKKAIASR